MNLDPTWFVATGCDIAVRQSLVRSGHTSIDIHQEAITEATQRIADYIGFTVCQDADIQMMVYPSNYAPFHYQDHRKRSVVSVGLTRSHFEPGIRPEVSIALSGLLLRDPDNLQATAVHELAHVVQRLGQPRQKYRRPVAIMRSDTAMRRLYERQARHVEQFAQNIPPIITIQ